MSKKKKKQNRNTTNVREPKRQMVIPASNVEIAGGSDAVEVVEGEMLTGTIKWFDVTKGYGFITTEDGKDIFVHFADIESGRTYHGFNKNDKVTFEMKDGKNGPQAAAVNLVPLK